MIERVARISARASAIIAKVAADLRPCFRAFRLPFGAPGFVPPCIRQRRFPDTAGDWHAAPLRVLAKHRGAERSRDVGSIGLFGVIGMKPSPCIERIGDDGLPARIDVHDLYRLLALKVLSRYKSIPSPIIRPLDSFRSMRLWVEMALWSGLRSAKSLAIA